MQNDNEIMDNDSKKEIDNYNLIKTEQTTQNEDKNQYENQLNY